MLDNRLIKAQQKQQQKKSRDFLRGKREHCSHKTNSKIQQRKRNPKTMWIPFNKIDKFLKQNNEDSKRDIRVKDSVKQNKNKKKCSLDSCEQTE